MLILLFMCGLPERRSFSQFNISFKIRREWLQQLQFHYYFIRTPFSTPVLYTNYVRQFCTPFLYTNSVRHFCTPILYASSVRQFSTPVIYVSSVRQFCTPVLYTNSVRQFCTPFLYTSSVHQLCTIHCVIIEKVNYYILYMYVSDA